MIALTQLFPFLIKNKPTLMIALTQLLPFLIKKQTNPIVKAPFLIKNNNLGDCLYRAVKIPFLIKKQTNPFDCINRVVRVPFLI